MTAAAITGATWQRPAAIASPAAQRSFVLPVAARRGVVLISASIENLDEGAAPVTGVDAGTGIVLTASGEILTANHVIAGATSVTVIDPTTGKHYSGVVVGYSVADGLALIQLIGASGLTPAFLGDSRDVGARQHVTTVGNALGHGRLVEAAGSVIATGQSIEISSPLEAPVLQSGLIVDDADSLGGYSGGPLLDGTDRVVGVDIGGGSDTFMLPGGSAESAAIPIDEALSVAAQIAAGRTNAMVHVGPTAFLGDETDSMYLLRDPAGCSDEVGVTGLTIPGDCVLSAVPSSPAAELELGTQDYDVIVGLDGQRVTSHQDAVDILATLMPGQRISVDWIAQNGHTHHGFVTLTSGPPL